MTTVRAPGPLGSAVDRQATVLCAKVEALIADPFSTEVLQELLTAGRGAYLVPTASGYTCAITEDARAWCAHEGPYPHDQFRDVDDDGAITRYLLNTRNEWGIVLCRTYGPVAENVNYHAYLQSLLWKLFRQYMLNYCGEQCANCGIVGVTLQVHHKNYENLGKERIVDVSVLCIPCHSAADQKRKIQASYSGRSRRRHYQ